MMNKFDLVFEQVMKSLDCDVKPSDKNRYAYKSVKLIIEDINSPINIDGATRKFSFEEAAGLSEAQLISEGIGDSFVEAVKSKMSAIAEALRTAKRKSESECLSILNAAKDNFIIKWLDSKYRISNKIKSAISTKIENGVTIMDVHAFACGDFIVVPSKNVVIKDTSSTAEESVTEPNSDLIEEGIAEAMTNLKNRLKSLWNAVLKICVVVLLILMAYLSISSAKAGTTDGMSKYDKMDKFNPTELMKADMQRDADGDSYDADHFDVKANNDGDDDVDANLQPAEDDSHAELKNIVTYKNRIIIRVFDEHDNLIDSIKPENDFYYRYLAREMISIWGNVNVKIVGNISYSRFEGSDPNARLIKRVSGSFEHEIGKDLSAKHKEDYFEDSPEYIVIGDGAEYYSNGQPIYRNGKRVYKNSRKIYRTRENDEYWDDLVYLLTLNAHNEEFASMTRDEKAKFLKRDPERQGLLALNRIPDDLMNGKLMEDNWDTTEKHEDWHKTRKEISDEEEQRREQEEIRRLVRQGH